jgi:predicted dehydrogenase
MYGVGAFGIDGLDPDSDVLDTFDELIRRDNIDGIEIYSPNVLHVEETIAAATVEDKQTSATIHEAY